MTHKLKKPVYKTKFCRNRKAQVNNVRPYDQKFTSKQNCQLSFKSVKKNQIFKLLNFKVENSVI